MFNRRVTVRHTGGRADRCEPKDEAEFGTALRDELKLFMTDDEIRTCSEVMSSAAPDPMDGFSLHRRQSGKWPEAARRVQ